MDSKELYLADLWQVVLRSKWIVLASSVLCVAIAVTYSLLAKPYYRSTVLLSVVEHEEQSSGLSGLAGQLGGVASIAGLGVANGGSSTEYLAVLGSRQFAERFIVENELFPVLFSDEWDEEGERWIDSTPGAAPTIQDAWELFNEEIRSIRVDEETNLVSLSIEWHDRELASAWANQLVDRINKSLRERAISDAKKSLVFLTRELEKTSVVGLQQGLFSLIESKKRDEMLANVRDQFAFKIIDPAFVSDADSEVRPKKLFLVVFGGVFGVFIGVFIALLRGFVFIQPSTAN